MAETFEGLTVKFGADTVEFDNSVKGMNKALTSLRKDLSNTNKQLKFDPTNIDLLNKKMANFEEQARIGALKIKELKKQQAELGAEGVGTQEWNKLELEINKVEAQMLSVNNAMERTAKQIKDVGDPKSVYNLDKALDQVADELDTVNKKLQLDPSDVEASARKMQLLERHAQLSEDKVEALRKEQKLLGNDDLGRAEWQRLEKQIVETQLEAKEFKQQISGSTDLNAIGGKIDTSNLLQASQYAQQAGQAVVRFGQSSISAFNEVDDALDIITQKTGLSSQGFKTMFNNIVSDVPVEDLNEVGSAIGELNTQFGLTGNKLQNASTLMLKFANINSTDVTSSTINAKKVLEEFNLSAEELPTILDSVTSTAQGTGVSVDSLFSAIQNNYTALQNLNLTLPQSVELIGQLEKNGLNSGTVLKAMTKATTEYAKEGKTLSEGLAETTKNIQGAKTEQDAINEAVAIFGTKQGPLMAKALKSGALDFNNLGNSAENSKNKVIDVFNKQADGVDNLTKAQNQFKTAIAELGSALGETLAPILSSLASILGVIARGFSALPSPIKTFVVILGGILTVLAILSPMILSFSVALGVLGGAETGTAAATLSLGSALAFLQTTILPIIAVIGAIALVITGIILLIKNWSKIVQTFSNIWANVWASVKNRFSTIVNGIKTIFSGMITKIVSAFSSLKNSIVAKIKGIPSAIKSGLGNLASIGKYIINGILSGLSNIGSMIKDKIVNGLRSAKSGIGNIAKNIFSKGYGINVQGQLDNISGLNMAKDFIAPSLATVGGSSTSLNINVEANNANAIEIARQIERVIVRRLT